MSRISPKPTTAIINDQASSNYIDIGTMRMQWGVKALTTDNAETVTLPVSFASTAYIITIGINAGYTVDPGVGVPIKFLNKTTTTFQLDRDQDVNGTMSIDWFAIGLKP